MSGDMSGVWVGHEWSVSGDMSGVWVSHEWSVYGYGVLQVLQ